MDARQLGKQLSKIAKRASVARGQKRIDSAFARGQSAAEASRVSGFWRSPAADFGNHSSANPFPSDDERHAAFAAGWQKAAQ